MEDRSVLISSCSRRELARRRPARTVPLAPIMLALFVLVVVAAGAVIAARGGV